MNISCESDLKRAIFDWATKECRNTKQEVNSVNRRSILERDRFWHIRFATMTPNVFAKCIEEHFLSFTIKSNAENGLLASDPDRNNDMIYQDEGSHTIISAIIYQYEQNNILKLD